MSDTAALAARREAALPKVYAARQTAEGQRFVRLARAMAEQAERDRQAKRSRKARRRTAAREEGMTPEQRLAAKRLEGQLRRVRQGKTSPAIALALLETMAPALPVEVYDGAVDVIEALAAGNGQPLEIRPSWVARIRPLRDGLDAATRQARRREVHARTVGKGAMPTAGIEAENAGRVTLAQPWRAGNLATLKSGKRSGWDGQNCRLAQGGDVVTVRHPGQYEDVLLPQNAGSGEQTRQAELCGPVIALRPVWAVDGSGVVDDAATVFGIAQEGSRHAVFSPVGERTYFGGFGLPERYEDAVVTDWVRECDCKPTAKQAAAAAARFVPWRCDKRRHRIREGAVGGTVRVQVVNERRQWAVARQIGAASPWRVPDLGCDSPLREVASAWRAAAHDARLAELERREAYQRNGWVHGEAVTPLEPRDGVIEVRQHSTSAAGTVLPVCLDCRQMHTPGECAKATT